MREFLFRAYSKTLGKYIVEGFTFFGEWHTFDIFTDVIDNYWESHFSKVYESRILATNDLIVEQYIGTKDKKKVRIYEGDIVEHNGTRFTVEFAKSHHGFICVNKKQRTRGGFPNWRDGHWMWRVDKYLQVVGNIHDDDEEEGLKYHLEDYDEVKHKIRACPKCGGAPDRNNCGPELQGVSCFTCGIHSTEGREFGSNKMLISAIGMWNRREFD